jgi:hypothetical protein
MSYSFDLYKADGNRRSQFQAHNFVATLWHYTGNEWVEVEKYVGASGVAVVKGYFWSTCIAGDKYKITFAYSDSYFPISDREWIAGTSNHGYPEATGAYYTWETYKTRFRLIFIDPQDAPLTPDTVAFYTKDITGYHTVPYNSYIDGYLVGHNSASQVAYKITATLSGYDDVTLEATWPVVVTYEQEINVVMNPSALTTDLTVSVADYRTGQTISDATIVVTNTSTGQVITPTSPGVYEVVYNRDYVYNVAVSKTGYDSSTMTITPTTADPVVADIALIPQPAYHIDVIAEDTKQPILGYTAKAYLDGSLIETSTNGDFYVAWDGTSTYSVVVTAEGYQTYTYTGTAYPAAPLELIEKSTRLQFTVTDNVTGSTVVPDVVIVRNHATGAIVPATEGYYVVDLGMQYDYVIQRSGYYDSNGSIVATQRGMQTETVVMTLIPLTTDLIINVTDSRRGTVIDDATIVVTRSSDSDVVTPVNGKYPLVYNYGYTYNISVNKTDYTGITDSVTPTTPIAIVKNYVLVKTLRYAKLYVTVTDSYDNPIDDAVITVTDQYTGDDVVGTDGYYSVICNDNEPYVNKVTADKYHDYISDVIMPTSEDDITETVVMQRISAPLTVVVQDNKTLEDIEDPEIVVYDETISAAVVKDGDVWLLGIGDTYSITVNASGYAKGTVDPFEVYDDAAIVKTVLLTKTYDPFATVDEYMALTGKTLTADEMTRVEALLVSVSDLIRYEGSKVDIDVDDRIADDPIYANIVKMVTIDVVSRVMRRSQDSEPVSQYSESALGYSFSATAAIPGGGIAMSLMNNERKILGFKRQKMQGVSMWHRE